MSLTGVILDGVLITLLLVALGFGLRLDARLKALKSGQDAFAKAVSELDNAAIRAHHSLKDLRAEAQSEQDILHDRILAARTLSQKLELSLERADTYKTFFDQKDAGLKALVATVGDLKAVQSNLEQKQAQLKTGQMVLQKKSEALAASFALGQTQLSQTLYSTQSLTNDVAPQIVSSSLLSSSSRDAFERDVIKLDSVNSEPNAVRPPSLTRHRVENSQRIRPADLIKDDDAADSIVDKLQISELVVANLNALIQNLEPQNIQAKPISPEEDLF